jgi:hypothetical protein
VLLRVHAGEQPAVAVPDQEVRRRNLNVLEQLVKLIDTVIERDRRSRLAASRPRAVEAHDMREVGDLGLHQRPRRRAVKRAILEDHGWTPLARVVDATRCAPTSAGRSLSGKAASRRRAVVS